MNADVTRLKQQAAEYAVKFVEPGMVAEGNQSNRGISRTQL